jgi:GlpG protein
MDGFEQFRIWLRYSRLTATLIAISAIIALLSNLGQNYAVLKFLLISEYRGGLPEILGGQLWRLVTPIVIHFGILHFIFNMLWLYDLGSVVEQRQGMRRMAILVLVTAVLSNLAQFFWSGPGFGGMSGVVYGLLAYAWVQGNYNPRAGIGLHQNIAIMMLVWFVICWLGLVGNVANMAHTVGLVCGAGLGLVFSPQFWRRLKY